MDRSQVVEVVEEEINSSQDIDNIEVEGSMSLADVESELGTDYKVT